MKMTKTVSGSLFAGLLLVMLNPFPLEAQSSRSLAA